MSVAPDDDRRWMAAALRLASRGLGQVWPNPAVGCLIVDADGIVVGRGWTQPGGRPHAERVALDRAGARARGACAYVSLEPCGHHGETPPCTDALIAAGIARVVAAVADPDPRVSGAGLERLRQAGLTVETDVLGEAAARLNRGFFSRIERGRPAVTVKIASTADAQIATADGASQWITGPAARRHGHLLRASHDAILVGSGTVLADDPLLTCRLPGIEGRDPLRVILDGRGRLPADAKLVASAGTVPSLWFTGAETPDAPRIRAAGIERIDLPLDELGHASPAAALEILGARGITRVLVEGGGALSARLLAEGLVDEIAWYRAPALLGADARAAVAALGIANLAERLVLRPLETIALGEDRLETYAVQS